MKNHWKRTRDQERVRAYKRDWYRRNAKKANAYSRKYRQANPEKDRWTKKTWKIENPEAVRASDSRREARKRNAPGRGISLVEWREIVAGSLGLCAYCGRPTEITVDHIEPLSRGGAHDVDNAAPACHSCNASKRAKPLIVWLAQRRAA